MSIRRDPNATLNDEALRKAELRRKNEIKDLNAVLATKSGRAVIRRVLDRAGAFRDTFEPDSHAYAHAGGKRTIGLWLFNEVFSNNRKAFLQMMAEANKELK